MTSSLTVGTHIITAAYSGDTGFNTSYRHTRRRAGGDIGQHIQENLSAVDHKIDALSAGAPDAQPAWTILSRRRILVYLRGPVATIPMERCAANAVSGVQPIEVAPPRSCPCRSPS